MLIYPRMNIKLKRYFASSAVIFLCVSLCHASTVGIIITPEGIVMGADGRARGGSTPCNTETSSTMQKVFLLRHRFLLGGVLLGGAKSEDGSGRFYNLPALAHAVESKIHRHTTVQEFFQIVEDESTKELAFVTNDIDKWTCGLKGQPTTKDGGTLVQFLMAGFEAGVPLAYHLDFK